MEYPSKLVEGAVEAFNALPGIGKKTALRLVMHFLQNESEITSRFTDALLAMREGIHECIECHNISDTQVCDICSNTSRDRSVLCIVENFRDVIAIENTGMYKGQYHVIGKLISPMDGIGPDQLHISNLKDRIHINDVREIIMALNPTINGDTTLFYITKLLQSENVKITTIARGIAFGGELEYVDDITLARSLSSRQPYEQYLTGR
jgi:recombination protein RecR